MNFTDHAKQAEKKIKSPKKPQRQVTFVEDLSLSSDEYLETEMVNILSSNRIDEHVGKYFHKRQSF
jgi:hypothetical protein